MSDSPLIHDQLVVTKFFIPSSSHALIARPRLTELLSRASLQHALTLISAPAGFGKTTLLAAWLHSLQAPRPCAAWISLDEEDNDPQRFWSSVLTALDRQHPGPYAALLAYLQAQQTPPLSQLVKVLINTLSESEQRVLLVLDDYHLITEQAVHTSLSWLVELLPTQVHLLLATRTDPPLPLSRLRGRGQMLEVRTDQLRCTAEETASFLKLVLGIALSREQAQDVTARTEGWLVGLQMVGLSLQGHTDPEMLLDALSGSQRYILDYLVDEVLGQQEASVQTFLQHTSILERLSAPLCDTILERSGSQQVLEYLERANVFVVALDAERRWYRYHQLFAEALRYRLNRLEGAQVAALNLRASRWYAGQGFTSEAVQHALSAQAWLGARCRAD
jgi:LuxR family transcriptional regulator, maltose regulon positive regulatory protein